MAPVRGGILAQERAAVLESMWVPAQERAEVLESVWVPVQELGEALGWAEVVVALVL